MNNFGDDTEFSQPNSFIKGSAGSLDLSLNQRDRAVSPKLPSEALEFDKKLLNQPRRLTFLQLNDVLNELIETKLKSEIKCIDTRLPRRTMEGHVHETFKTKFGLRHIVSEQMVAFLHTLKYFSAFDSRVRAFLMILRNECEEEFLYSLREVESTLKILLKVEIPSSPDVLVRQQALYS